MSSDNTRAKSISLSIRLNEVEHAEIKGRADEVSLKLGAFIKKIAAGQAIKKTLEADPKLIHQMARLGNQLNQLTRHLNTALKSGEITGDDYIQSLIILSEIEKKYLWQV